MSLINTPVWATVSMPTVQATPIWKKYQDSSGKIDKSLYKEVIAQALKFLGHDPEKGGYKWEDNVNIRSNSDLQVVFINTSLFTFPVRDNYAYKGIYQKNDILHFGDEGFSGWGVTHIKMQDFGNEHDPSREEDTEI